ncbi:unnamed protein product [Cylindrotheca closterium]|uniref:Peptidase M50 domain-containing protein n=1 Tax=Cylindrotheca closterium TaxID=2856 RepID=A0AAD2CK56_9STRA|nr:unnamed protein product [Cylindrotheca closterium]
MFSVNASSVDSSLDDFDFSSKGDWRKEAELLRAKAQAIRSEARAMEVALLANKKQQRDAKTSESDNVIDSLFPPKLPLPPPQKLAEQLKTERWSIEVINMVVDRMFERQMIAVGQKIPEDKGLDFSVGGRADKIIQVDGPEFDRLEGALDILQEAAAVLDLEVETEEQEAQNQTGSKSNVASRRRRGWDGRLESAITARRNELDRVQREIRNRKFATEINRIANTNQSIAEFIRRSALNLSLANDNQEEADLVTSDNPIDNATQVLETLRLTPMWVPASFLPYIISSGKSTLGPEQVQLLESSVLQGSRFFVTSSDSIPGAAIFRGNLRTISGTMMQNTTAQQTSAVFGEIQERLQKEGLAEAVQLFFLPDPEWQFKRDEVQQAPKPVLLALSKSVSPDMSISSTLPNAKLIASTKSGIAYALAIFTTLAYSISTYALNPSFFKAIVNHGKARVLARCVPIFLGVVGIQLVHEAGHYFVAKRRGMRIGNPVPVFSFSTGLGLYGCITPLKSFPPNRASLLDFALSGPFAGILASLGCIIAGISMTTRASTTALSTFPFVTAAKLKSSFLVGSILSCLASKSIMLPAAQPVPIHPLFTIGHSGLVASALNLLPIFRLDGGRAFAAAMGARQTPIVSVAALLLLLSQSLTGGSAIGFAWAIIILIFQRRDEVPARDEVTDIDNLRFGTWLFSLLLSFAILSPFPGNRGIIQ